MASPLRLLCCKGCSHEWRAAEPRTCPKCNSAEVLSRCGAKTKRGPCRKFSLNGAARCDTHNGKKQQRNAGALGRFSSWSDRTYAAAVIRAASEPDLRDLAADHAIVQRHLDLAAQKAAAGEGGRDAWRRLVKLVGSLRKAYDQNPDKVPALLEQMATLVTGEACRSTAEDDLARWADLRATMLDKESAIQHRAKAAIPIMDVQVMIQVLVALVRELATPEVAGAVGRRIAMSFPGINSEARLEAGN